jgi:DNA-binding response OmpR family regulator
MANILCTGVHPGLIYTRKLVLEHAGHCVVTALNAAEIETACRNITFDVAVIGQVTEGTTKVEWERSIRRYCPSVKILEVFLPGLGMALTDADDWLPSPAEPTQLAVRVSALAARYRKREQGYESPTAHSRI